MLQSCALALALACPTSLSLAKSSLGLGEWVWCRPVEVSERCLYRVDAGSYESRRRRSRGSYHPLLVGLVPDIKEDARIS